MAIEVRIPTLGESISEGVIVRWIKADGEAVQTDEPLLELETDKASVEIPAAGAGVLSILKQQGEKVAVGDVVARIDDGAAVRRASPPPAQAAPTPAPAAPLAAESVSSPTSAVLSPAVRRLVEEHQLDPRAIKASGRGGRLTKSDVLAHLESVPAAEGEKEEPGRQSAPNPPAPLSSSPPAGTDEEERVPMTHLRQRIAQRLVEAQRTAAILTTFNEIDMSAVMELRGRYKARFTEIHGVSLGFMSFFARACIGALADVRAGNARHDRTHHG